MASDTDRIYIEILETVLMATLDPDLWKSALQKLAMSDVLTEPARWQSELWGALKRLDLEKAGSRSNLIRQSYGPSSSTGPGSTSDGGSQDNQSSRSGGWSIVGSARGGKGQRRGSSNVVKSPKRASAAILLSNPTS